MLGDVIQAFHVPYGFKPTFKSLKLARASGGGFLVNAAMPPRVLNHLHIIEGQKQEILAKVCETIGQDWFWVDTMSHAAMTNC
jgi:hypothetical protein